MRFLNPSIVFTMLFAAAGLLSDGLLSDGSLSADEPAISPSAKEQVLQGLTDLTLLRDSVLKRYTLMVTGESQTIYDAKVKRPPLQIDRIYRLQAADKQKNLTYRASGKVMGPESSSRTYEFQYWVELYECKGETKGRAGSVSRHGYKVREQQQSIPDFIKQQRLSGVRFDPFDDLVLHAMFLRNPEDQYGWIEQVYLQQSELLEAETITQGDLRSRWRWKHYTLDFEIELLQSKAFDYLPVKVKYVSQIEQMPRLFAETEIEWRNHAASGKYLPHLIKAASGSPYGHKQEHHHWVFDWRIGKQIPDDFFRCSLDDFRPQFSPLYEFYFDSYGKPGGVMTGTPWKTPAELADESQ